MRWIKRNIGANGKNRKFEVVIRDEELRRLKEDMDKLTSRNKKIDTELRKLKVAVKTKGSSVDKFTKFKESLKNHKQKSSRVRSGIDYTKLATEFRKKDRKHLKTEVIRVIDQRLTNFRSTREIT